jgi:hypothetical protein
MKMMGTKIVVTLTGLTILAGTSLASQPSATYDPSHDPDQAMKVPQTPKDVKSHFDSKGSDCGAEFNVTDAYVTHFGKTGRRSKAAVFLVTVKNEAHAKNFYVQPTNQGPLHTKSLAQPYKGAYDSATTSYVYTNANSAGLDTFTILDDRVRRAKTFVYDLSVEMNGKVITCSNVTITRN